MTPLWQFVKRLGGHVRARYRKIKRWFKGGKPAEGDPKTVAVFLAGAFTLVATALAVIGLGEGDIDRAVVNERWWSLLGFGAIVIAVGLGSLMSLAPTVRLRGLCGAAGVVVLGIGLVTLATAAVDGRIAKDRPRIEAHIERLSDGMHVKGTVTAAGLTAQEHVLLRIIGISSRDRLAEAHIGHQRGHEATASCLPDDTPKPQAPSPVDTSGAAAPGGSGSNDSSKTREAAPKSCWRQLLYSSRTGAASDGKINLDIDTPLAVGLYERVDIEALLLQPDAGKSQLTEPRCDKNAGGFGCVTLMIPPGARRPELDAHWEMPPSSPPVLPSPHAWTTSPLTTACCFPYAACWIRGSGHGSTARHGPRIAPAR